ncbi:PASTA domain-containing protein [Actinomadura sp. ATCC 31491]|uniref:PASTA domain-containing protein n=1 Tax=Actinomadura luzonensis TaxID=2805427 RepID=A0ABT0FNY1_9ACTN|nr:PASTA domain-containing protein [Actinomadura luzonensis]MCK2214061.1 PASTA domain-containing protein [Actinomadura luzonensis]
MTHQPPMPPPARRGFSGPAVALIAVLALGAGCVGGVAVGSVGNTPTTTTSPTKTAAAEALQDTSLPPAEEEKGRLVKLPDFKGQNAAIARQWLVDRGWNEFSDIKLGSQDQYDTMVLLPENWTVTKQSHKAGTKVKIGTTIVLTCTKAS